ncbi:MULTISPECIES: hypothetical protein [Bordetella]|uniref:Uncharacterized protein n=1 Tax=Bordetella bronchiseptica 00-P-2796 TaxID=1331199 RepID=A0ABR4RFH7_BORBO|nr:MULTISPECIES: hypothetical protein [Bordetella]KCV35242.1 hypothetical protein L490_5039 [Bordetella bronchiseptica 00-P-2796]KDC06360.1 hypothetical protein AZ24_0186 [Bordetella bronchiseptica E013]SHS00949.1 Uncharacterised protein [Mycobacteroides abscessus subsp. abscessus]
MPLSRFPRFFTLSRRAPRPPHSVLRAGAGARLAAAALAAAALWALTLWALGAWP